MKKIECIIMDWAGTAVDYGCFAPVAAFIEAFAEKGLVIDVVQTRKPMGLPKIQHIRELLSMPDVNEQFTARYQRAWTEEDVVELNRLFEKHLFASLENYTDPIPYMIFENLTKLAVPSLDAVIKVGDTIADILEGVNAKVYSVGVILGSNEMALTEAETKSMPASEPEARIADVKERMLAAGASYVIRTIEELPALIETINAGN